MASRTKREWSNYRDWIDVLKFFSILLVVIGHSGLDLKEYLRPTSLEALGVGPFFLILGYNLSRSKRCKRDILIFRLFDLYFWGILAAILQATLNWYIRGNFSESNFLPFMLGINSFFPDHAVPGNPVLWFVGAYTHFVLLFVLVKRMPRITRIMLLTAMCLEIVIRCQDGVIYRSYTLFLNWISLFGLGVFISNDETYVISLIKRHYPLLFCAIVILIVPILFVMNKMPGVVSEGVRNLFVTSVLFIFSTGVRNNRYIQLIASNSLFIFLFHHILLHYIPWGIPWFLIIPMGISITFLFAAVSQIIMNLSFVDELRRRLLRVLQEQINGRMVV